MDPTAMDLSPLKEQAKQLRAEVDDLRPQIAAEAARAVELDRLDVQCRTFAEAADFFADSATAEDRVLLRKVAGLALDQAQHYRQLRRTVEEIRQVKAGRRQRSLYDELARRSRRLLTERRFERALGELIDEAS
jgi:cell division septum initiation protein DivIVA